MCFESSGALKVDFALVLFNQTLCKDNARFQISKRKSEYFQNCTNESGYSHSIRTHRAVKWKFLRMKENGCTTQGLFFPVEKVFRASITIS
jgi:hypothetical protein